MNSRVEISGSLRFRTAATLILGVTLLAILLFLGIRSYAATFAQQSQDSILGASLTSIIDAATLRDGVIELDIPYASFTMLNTATDDRIFYAVYNEGTLISGYEELQLPNLAETSEAVFRTSRMFGAPVRQVTATRILIDAHHRTRITASLAQTQDNLSGTLARISRHAAMIGVGFFALAVLLSIWATSMAISPLKRLADSLTRRGPQDLSPIIKPVPTEMVPLVASLNNLMARLDKSLTQSEDFIAEAAHRVRTPIATVRSHAEMTLQRVDKEENRHALRSMIRAIDETSRAAGQLLDHAMITLRADQLEVQLVNLYDTTEEIVLRLNAVAEMKDIHLTLTGSRSACIAGDSILLQNAIRNLIDNALKYAPAESCIEVEVHQAPTRCLVVRDQGPGFLIDEMDTLSDRFTRGKNAMGTIGSGLGLTIARDVAAAHHGRLVIENNATGGACVTLFF